MSAARPMSDADAAAIDATVLETYKGDVTKMSPAFYVAVRDPAKGTFVKSYGEAAPGRPATAADSLRIGSVTKTFTAATALQLVADGKLALATKVSEVLPELSAKFPAMAGLDVQSLLGMSSGLPDFMNSPTGAVPQVVANPSKAWTCEELIAIGLAQGVKPAGTTGYSTTNYLILQLMIEKLTGSTLDSQLQARFCVPMGMKGTYLPPNNNTALPEPAAHSVINENAQAEFAEAGGTVALGTDVTGWNASYGQGGGSMTGNICDLLTWADSLCGNTTLPPDLAAKRLELKEIMPGMNYGLGIHSEGSFLGHEGEALGWETYALKWPEKGISVALAGNSCKIKLLFLIILSALFPDAGVKVFA